MKLTVYATCDKDSMWQKGEELGLDGEALRMFSHFNEVKLELNVEMKTGVVTDHRVVK